MSRSSLSPEMKAALFAPQTDEEFITLITIDHASMVDPIRVNSSGDTIESRGEDFVAFPFTLLLPDDTSSRAPRAKLSIDNIDRQIVQVVRTLTSAPTVLIEIIRAADPDTVEVSFPDFKFTNITYDALRVEGDLSLEEFMTEPYPQGIFTPNLFPGLF